jgi:hypothetical protein
MLGPEDERRVRADHPALQHFSTLSPSGFACQHVSKKQGADVLTG